MIVVADFHQELAQTCEAKITDHTDCDKNDNKFKSFHDISPSINNILI
jgi:hypothetical protein